ncbi:MAG: fused MFS/spermidine synthase [Planctomycetota bacterium]|jgi:predicted membrane-bound spermidine synthase
MKPEQPLAGMLLFFSGATALVYQTLWVKQLGLLVGVDVYAVTTAVAAFFAGLALGGAVFGRRADRASRPFGLYAALEFGAALLGVGATLLLAAAARVVVALGPFGWAVPFLLVGLPAFLMGGTLPAMVRALAPAEETVGRASGRLYGANTAGAVAGTLATAFWLVPAFGIRGSALAAGGVNVLLGLAALALNRERSVTAPAAREPLPREARLAVTLYAVAGGIALGYEVVWTQAIVPFLSTRAFAFAVVLATYLLGLVVGSLAYARMADRIRRPWIAFGVLVAGAGVTALALFGSLGPWLSQLQGSVGQAVLDATGSRLAMMCGRFAVAACVLVLPVTILLGAAFPVAVRLAARSARVGRDVGWVAALNTAGGIAGTFLTGFVAVPVLGLMRTLGALAVAAAVVGAIAITRGGRPRLAWVPVAAAILAAVVIPHDQLARRLAAMRGGTLVFYEESAGGTVAVLEQRAFRRLYIQGVSNSGDALPSLRYMRLQALLPLMIHRGEPRSALVIGLGTGITSGALLAYPALERRVCAELLPAVVRAAPLFQGNLGAATDPRLEIRLRDGRRELLASDERYDLITLEPPPPSAAGVVNLYSRDFYELCRERLAEDGLIAQWLPLATQNDEDSRSLVRSLLDVFRHVTLWTTEVHETLLVGSSSPIELDLARIGSRFRTPEVAKALGEVGVDSPRALVATYVTDRAGLERYAGDAPPVTDDRPRIEYAPWVREGEFARVLMRIANLRSPLPIADLDKRIERERQMLWAIYRAVHYSYTGQGDRWEKLMRRLAPHAMANAYYRSFLK